MVCSDLVSDLPWKKVKKPLKQTKVSGWQQGPPEIEDKYHDDIVQFCCSGNETTRLNQHGSQLLYLQAHQSTNHLF